jgi:hypothetical protein
MKLIPLNSSENKNRWRETPKVEANDFTRLRVDFQNLDAVRQGRGTMSLNSVLLVNYLQKSLFF